MPKITKKIIDSASPQKKDFIVWDSELKGFGCRVLPTGRKTYVFFYRSPKNNKSSYLKIGVHGNVTCDIARDIAQGWAGDLARGVDPKAHKEAQEKERKSSLSFKEFTKIYLEIHASQKNKESTFREYQRLLKNHLLPFFGESGLQEITRKDVHAFHSALSQKITANRCLSVLSKILSVAKDFDYYQGENPCFRLKRYKENKRENFLKEDDLIRLENVLQEQEILRTLSPYAVSAIRMLLYTGCRRNEVLKLKWEDIFLEESYLRLQDSKGGKREVPLNEAAKKVLRNLEHQEGNPYVFPGKIPGKPLQGLKSQWKTITRRAHLKDTTIHDLRHTFASLGVKQGLDLYQISKLLGHKDIHTTQRYAHLQRKDLTEASNIVGNLFLRSEP